MSFPTSRRPLSVAVWTHSFGSGGQERSAVRIAEVLWRRGYRVACFSASPDRSHTVELDPAIPVEVVCASPKDPMTRWARLCGAARLSLRFGLPPLDAYRWSTRLLPAPSTAGRLRRFRPDVVLSFGLLDSLRLLLLPHDALLHAVLVAAEQTEPRSYLEQLFGRRMHSVVRMLRLLYPRVDALTANSSHGADSLKSLLSPDARPVKVIPSPVSVERVRRLADLPLPANLDPGGQQVLLYVGRHAPEKNLPLLLDAFALVRPRHAVQLWLTGDGGERRSLEARVRRGGLSNAVRFLGYVENPFALMKRSSALLLTSRYEGNPVVLLEAMACGTPIVCAQFPGAEEVLGSPAAGLLAEPRAEEVAAQVCRVLEEDGLSARLTAVAAQRVEGFDSARIANRYEALFLGLLEGRPDCRNVAPPRRRIDFIDARDRGRRAPV